MAKIMNIVKWLIISVLVLFIAGCGFIYFNPGYDLLFIRSQSMEPSVKMGDLIVTGPQGGPINGDIQPGMIVTYQHGDETITHRVLSVEGETLTMKGDNLEHPDPWPVTLSDVKGIYLFKIPLVGYVVTVTRTKLGWFLTIIIPTTVLVGWLCFDILKEAFRNENGVTTKKERKAPLRAPAYISQKESKVSLRNTVNTRKTEVPLRNTVNSRETNVPLRNTAKRTVNNQPHASGENLRNVLLEALNSSYEASKD
ncbi:MAG: signal peptidase I [Dehalococcoidales bacterium]|nr:signal peptidase I [Dehalococcoidales bacterium]